MVFGIAHIWAILLLTRLLLNYNVVLSQHNDQFDIQLIVCPPNITMNARQNAAHIFAILWTKVCMNVYIGTNISQASSDNISYCLSFLSTLKKSIIINSTFLIPRSI